jgi:hypothetical protein
MLSVAPLPFSHEVLQQKAREMSIRLGHVEPIGDSYATFDYDSEYDEWLRRNLTPDERRASVVRGEPAIIRFIYRRSPDYLDPLQSGGVVTAEDPPMTVPGMVTVWLDSQARLLRLQAVPSRIEPSPATRASSRADWNGVLEAAGLDRSRWKPAEPREIPSVPFDERYAWTGTYAAVPNVPMRIEAAAWEGRLVSFETQGPRRPLAGGSSQPLASLLLLPIAAWFAWRNQRQQRGDTGGALRLAAFVFVCSTLVAILGIHHVPVFEIEARHILDALAYGLATFAPIAWIFYVALEPHVRRQWPQALISWTRVLAGDIRNPIVSAHLLASIALGVGMALFETTTDLVAWQTNGTLEPAGAALSTLAGTGLIATLLTGTAVPVLAMGLFILLVILRLVLQRTWLAAGAIVMLFMIPIFLGGVMSGRIPPSVFVEFFVNLSLSVIVMVRFGILPLVVTFLVSDWLSTFPLTSDLSVWYADKVLIAVGLVAAAAIWSFRVTLAGRRVVHDDLLSS